MFGKLWICVAAAFLLSPNAFAQGEPETLAEDGDGIYPDQEHTLLQDDVVIRRGDHGRIDMFRVILDKDPSGASDLTALVPVDEYDCDHEPPQPGDSCTCGGTGWDHLDYADCAFLKIDCADGAWDAREQSCSNWDGDPLPDLP